MIGSASWSYQVFPPDSWQRQKLYSISQTWPCGQISCLPFRGLSEVPIQNILLEGAAWRPSCEHHLVSCISAQKLCQLAPRERTIPASRPSFSNSSNAWQYLYSRNCVQGLYLPAAPGDESIEPAYFQFLIQRFE